MVASAEVAADLGQRELRQFLRERHGHLARPRDRARTLLRVHLRGPDLVVVGDRLLDVLDRDLAVLDREQVAQRFLGERERDLLPVKVRVGDDPLERAFELAHVAANVLGDEERDLLVEAHPGLLGLREQDRDAHLELGRFQGHGEAPAEAGDQPFLDARDLLRVGVAGDDHLLVAFDERVEQVEELFLRAALAAEELDVVDEEQVERPVVALELVERLVLVGAHDVGHVGLGVDVADLRVGLALQDVVADRLDQVGLAQPHASIDEERVVRRRVLGDLDARGTSELIGLAGHERVERERAVEARGLDPARHGGLRARRLRCRSDLRNRGRIVERTLVVPGRGFDARVDGGGGRRGDLVRDRVFDGERHAGGLAGHRRDPAAEPVLYPLEDETVGRAESQAALAGLDRERPDPRGELLRRELALEDGEAGRPGGGRRGGYGHRVSGSVRRPFLCLGFPGGGLAEKRTGAPPDGPTSGGAPAIMHILAVAGAVIHRPARTPAAGRGSRTPGRHRRDSECSRHRTRRVGSEGFLDRNVINAF